MKQRELDYKRSQDQRAVEIAREERARVKEMAEMRFQSEVDHQRRAAEDRLLARRVFNDQLNVTRIAKIAEVWERVDAYEAEASSAVVVAIGVAVILSVQTLVEDLGAGAGRPRLSDEQKKYIADFQQKVNEVTRLEQEARTTAARNRFWLGEERYKRVLEYLGFSSRLLSEVQRKGVDPKRILDRRKQLREQFLLVRDQLSRE